MMEKACLSSQAFEIARKFHKDHKYGVGSFVDKHLLPVANLALTYVDAKKDNIDYVMAVAWLHDFTEDGGDPTLISHFPQEVVGAVATLDKNNYANTDMYLSACKMDPIAYIVKLADQVCNMNQCIKDKDFKRAEYYAKRIEFLLG